MMIWVMIAVVALFVFWAAWRYRGRERSPGHADTNPTEGRHGNRGAYWSGGGGA